MTHSHLEEEIEKGCEEEREGSPIPIFPPLRFGIVRIFPSSVGFCSQVSALWGKRGSTGLKLRPTVTWRRKLREVVRKRGKVPLYLYFQPQAPELWDCWLAKWAFALKFRSVGKTFSFVYKLKREFYMGFGVLLLTGFWVVEEAFIPYDTILVFWLGLLLFREEFGVLFT